MRTRFDGRITLELMLCAALFPTAVHAQSLARDTAPYATVRMDSAQIRRLPLSRSSEVPSYLPGSLLDVEHSSSLRATIGREDVRVDGVPVGMFTFKRNLLFLPADAITTVERTATGSSVEYSDAAALSYASSGGGTEWRGYARGGGDIGLATSPGGLRAALGATGPLGRLIRFSANVSAQSAQRSEFNRFTDVPVFGVVGVDTTITYTANNGQSTTVDVPRFEELSGSRIPDSNWNELLGSARLDLVSGASTNIFVATHFTRLQARLPFGGICAGTSAACNAFNSSGQEATRQTGWLGVLGAEQMMGRSRFSLRVARTKDEILNGVLTEADALAQNSRSGLDLNAFDFLVEPADYPVEDALIRRVIANEQTDLVPLQSRFELNASTLYLANPYGASGYRTHGIGSNYRYAREDKFFASLVWRAQFGGNTVKAGAELSSLDARYADVPYTSPVFLEVWKENPSIQSGFISDLLDIGNVVIDAGVRIDSYNPNTEYSSVPGFIDPSVMKKAERQTVFSPRIAVAAATGPAVLRVSYVAAAQVPFFTDQFNGINADFFRFRNTNTQTQFARPLELVEIRAFNGSVDFAPSERLRVRANATRQQTDNAVAVTMLPWEDPTNPGSTTYLRVPQNRMSHKATGIDVTAEYYLDPRHSVRLTGLHESRDFTVPGVLTVADNLPDITGFVGVMQVAGPRVADLHDFDLTLALRARSGIETFDNIDFDKTKSSWLTRLDARVSRSIKQGPVTASFWADVLRLVGSSPLFERNVVPESYVEAQMAQLGRGMLQDVDLSTLAAAGLRNEVDLHLARRAEERFGDGDLNFTMNEQRAAFNASGQLHTLASRPVNPGRRLIVGVELSF